MQVKQTLDKSEITSDSSGAIMSAIRKNLGFLIVASLIHALCLGNSRADDLSVAGVYVLVEINGSELPAVSWSTDTGGQGCREETLNGTVLFGSDGAWAGLIAERMVCKNSDGSEDIGDPSSSILSGSYTIAGNQITIIFDGIVSTGQYNAEKGLLVFKTVGVGPFEGQTLEYVLRRN